jgi:hypothetical protein
VLRRFIKEYINQNKQGTLQWARRMK